MAEQAEAARKQGIVTRQQSVVVRKQMIEAAAAATLTMVFMGIYM